MKISTKGRYSLRVMLDLAMHNTGEYIPLKDIAGRQEITVKYLEQIISILNKTGYLRSLRGNSGGYQLARKPENYVIGDILRTAEGSLAPLSCQMEDGCPAEGGCCAMQQFWAGLNRVIAEYVDSYTLADLVDQQKQVSELDFSI
ncbi:MAG: RrF2 family transcriptional regulator [Oscillospiraceae bacterium]|jgi:Rrf2 family protein|nr:RrF2 family transcriptional regulator [Oscillospiraceae bacterium]